MRLNLMRIRKFAGLLQKRGLMAARQQCNRRPPFLILPSGGNRDLPKFLNL